MSFLHQIPISQIDESHIQRLFESEIPEGKQLDYKRDLPGDEKRAFLADVCALANTSGGDIIYGIDEKRDETGKLSGLPEKVVGAVLTDSEKTRLGNIVRDGIAPATLRVTFHTVMIGDGKQIQILRVLKSTHSPHMICFQDINKFYGRADSTNYIYGIDQIRNAFLAGAEMNEKIRAFREKRISEVLCNRPIQLLPGPKVIVHIVPLVNFGDRTSLQLEALAREQAVLVPNGLREYSYRFNLDGFLVHSNNYGGGMVFYAQVFRDGCIEAGMSVEAGAEAQGGDNHFHSESAEGRMTMLASGARKFYSAVDVDHPVMVAVSLVDVRGFYLGASAQNREKPEHRITENLLLLPEIVVNEKTQATAEALQPIYDVLWQAFGYPRSKTRDSGLWGG